MTSSRHAKSPHPADRKVSGNGLTDRSPADAGTLSHRSVRAISDTGTRPERYPIISYCETNVHVASRKHGRGARQSARLPGLRDAPDSVPSRRLVRYGHRTVVIGSVLRSLGS